MLSYLRHIVGLAALSSVAGCIDPPKAPYVAVHDLGASIHDAQATAEQGSPEQQYRLGLRYEHLVLDYGEAARWYRMAAIQQHSEAIYRLCHLSGVGRGVPQDDQEALRWCRLAADHGHARAMFTMGTYFETGRGVPRDFIQAHMWYNLAAANGDEEAVRRRNRLAMNMVPRQVEQAQFQARNWRGKYQVPTQYPQLNQQFPAQ